MKKIKLFDHGVFLEGFRHLKVPGILFLIVYSLPIIIDFILSFTTKKASTSLNGIIDGSDLAYTALSLSFFGILLLVIFILAAPILTISAFRFLTKRNASDIYHSLPFKRETIFISLFTAVAAWLGIISIGSSLLSLVSSLIINSSSFAFSNWILSALASFISLLFVAACFAIAVNITGTLGSNIVVGFLITYLPRLVINSITQAIISSLPILTSEHLSFFLKNQYNLLTSSYGTYLLTRSYSSLYTPSIYACIYTLAVSLIYIVLACILFRRRKSESAAQSAPNRTLQAVYRIALCMVICIFVLTALFNNITKGDIVTAYRSLIWYIVAIVAYFAYELITTRRFKNLLKALPGLGIVVVVNLAIYGIMAGVRSYELSYAPEKEKITSVAVSFEYIDLDSSQYSSSNIYADNKTIDIDLYDESAISIVADSLKKNVEALKVSKTEYGNNFRSGNDRSNGYQSTTVKIKTTFGTKYRRIFISTPDLAKIKNIYYNNNEYREMYKKLPKASSGNIYINLGSINLSNKKLSEKTLDDIYEKAREEIAQCDFELLHKKLNAVSSLSITLNYTGYDNNGYYSIKIPLQPDIMPKAYEMFLEKYYSESAENRKEIKEFLKDYKNKRYSVTIQFYKGENTNTVYELNKSVASLILNNEKEGAPKIGDTFAVISLRTSADGIISMSNPIETIINLSETDISNIYNAYAYS